MQNDVRKEIKKRTEIQWEETKEWEHYVKSFQMKFFFGLKNHSFAM